jgi:pyruvate dehydrogenase E2 component (dihydrolipoamide acetyltransferase)
MEVEAVDEGKIGKIVVPEGTDNVKVNAVIAVLLTEGESAADAKAPAPAPAAKAPTPSAAAPTSPPKGVVGQGAAAATPLPGGRGPSEARGEGALTLATRPANGARVFASPLARRLAKESNIDVSAIAGSGPHGRVVKSDVEAVKSGKSQLKAPPAVPSGAPAGAGLAHGKSKQQVVALYDEGSYDIVPNDGMRKVVAARLTEAWQTVPHFYLTLDCRIDALMEAREKINAAAPLKDGKPTYRISVNDFVIKAWALALQKVPAANATWAGDSVLRHRHSDVANAVSIPGGLFTPVIKSAETKTLREISAEMRDFAARAKSKKLAPHEYQGGSTSISNLGMFGIREFGAVINPPHGTILAVGAGEERVYAEKGQVKVGQFMTVTCACDHRAVDGALGAELLAAFKALIETPIMMLA